MKRFSMVSVFLLLAFFVQGMPAALAGGSTAGVYETNVGDKYLIADKADQFLMSFTVEPWEGISSDLTIEGLDITCAPAHGFSSLKLIHRGGDIGEAVFSESTVNETQSAHFGASDFVLPRGVATELAILVSVDENTGRFITACAIDDLFLKKVETGNVFSSEAQAVEFDMEHLVYVDDVNETESPVPYTFDSDQLKPDEVPLNSKGNLLMSGNFSASGGAVLEDIFITCDRGDIIREYRLEVNGKTYPYTAMQNDWTTNSISEHSTVDRIVFAGIDSVVAEDVEVLLYGDTYGYFEHFPGDMMDCSVIDIKTSRLGNAVAVTLEERSLVASPSSALTNRLLGHILLQVETHGQAWYLDPESRLKYYLPDGAAAYESLRHFGLGITDADLAKIPVGLEDRFEDNDSDGDGLADQLEEGLKTNVYSSDSDGDGVDDKTEVLNGLNPLGAGDIDFNDDLTNRLKGRILLQVESQGEAWYVNPADGKRYYMKNGDAAYQIMRFLSLGITNDDIRKIPVGSM